MRSLFLFVMLLPLASFAQKWNYEGVYSMPEPDYSKIHLKPWDTIRQSFTFTADSFKYSYEVMRPNGYGKAVSVGYQEYGTWSIVQDTTLSEPDKHSGKTFTFERKYTMLDDGRISGYFEPAAAADSNANGAANPPLSFIRRGKVFSYSRKPVPPLRKE